MGNSCGAMHKYTDLTDTEPKYQGGFIWDYIDQSIYKKDRYGKDSRHAWRDFGDVRDDYNISVVMVLHMAETARHLLRCRK